MGTMGIGIVLIGTLVMIIGGIMFLIAAFSESILWGLACMFIPFVSLIFLVLHWSDAKKAFFVHLCGWAVFVFGMILGIVGGAFPNLQHRLH